jgi:hypothetical protein
MDPAQRALARFRAEEQAFSLVLEVLKEWRREDLFLRVFTVYRSRMRFLRRFAGTLVADMQQPSAFEDLERFAESEDGSAIEELRRFARGSDP